MSFDEVESAKALKKSLEAIIFRPLDTQQDPMRSAVARFENILYFLGFVTVIYYNYITKIIQRRRYE